jgi:hypothetical protein
METPTILNRAPLVWHADRYVHLEATAGDRFRLSLLPSTATLCGIPEVSARAATAHELETYTGTCAVCAAKAFEVDTAAEAEADVIELELADSRGRPEQRHPRGRWSW